eukprot:COSAG06_NODE_63673_length_261_cov_1.604938_1_plen_60_part_10
MSADKFILRTDVHALNQNRELYSLGGSGTGFKSAQITAGQFVPICPNRNYLEVTPLTPIV